MFGFKRYLPFVSFKVSSQFKPSSFVTILEVPAKAEPIVTVSSFLIPSRLLNSVAASACRTPRIRRFFVAMSSSPSHRINVFVILASESASSSLVTGIQPAYFLIVYSSNSKVGPGTFAIFPPSATWANPVWSALDW